MRRSTTPERSAHVDWRAEKVEEHVEEQSREQSLARPAAVGLTLRAGRRSASARLEILAGSSRASIRAIEPEVFYWDCSIHVGTMHLVSRWY